jgi:hypothetical protein
MAISGPGFERPERAEFGLRLGRTVGHEVLIGIFTQPNDQLSGNRQGHWESIQAEALLVADFERLGALAARPIGSPHSVLSAVTGSTDAARLAGNQTASVATPNSISGTAPKVTGSNALTP